MNVRHSLGSYEVSICSLAEAILALPKTSVIVTDENVDRLYSDRFPSGTQFIVVPPGEASKSVGQWGYLQSPLAGE